MKPYFIYKDKNSKDMGISILKLPPRTKPTRRGELITVPGRDGFLFESEDAYSGKTLEIECTFLPPENETSSELDSLIKEILVWLDGTGKLIFSDYPDYYYEATIINEIPIERVFKRYRRFLLTFEVQPFAKSIMQTTSTHLTLGKHNLSVSSYYKVKPEVKIVGVGNIDISINNLSIHLNDIDGTIILDSELLNASDGNGTNMNNHMIGEFPTLDPGDNEINISCDDESTFTSLEISYRGLWL